MKNQIKMFFCLKPRRMHNYVTSTKKPPRGENLLKKLTYLKTRFVLS